mmetsp:Transcript_26106/g.29044  ORF Transcript_26106/g.29044 Transcript_26106/m.29044 type:complete len:129 (-) Transcript_26106:69-455(-)
MIDEGETDWKIIAIDVNDPKASQINELEDVEKVYPGKLKQVFEFLRDYKVPDGKPQNVFAYDNQPQPKKFAIEVVEETHAYWQALVSKNETKDVSTDNTTIDGPYKKPVAEANKHVVEQFAKHLRAKQ